MQTTTVLVEENPKREGRPLYLVLRGPVPKDHQYTSLARYFRLALQETDSVQSLKRTFTGLLSEANPWTVVNLRVGCLLSRDAYL